MIEDIKIELSEDQIRKINLGIDTIQLNTQN